MIRTIAATSLLAGAAMAQVGSPIDIAQQALQFLSADCQQAVLSIANSSSPVYQCLQIDSLIPAITTNGSIIEPVDDYLSAVCYNEPCSPELMNQTANQFSEACGSELSMFGIDNSTIETVFGLYPLARDVVCLKNNETESLDNATVPIEQGGYNSTNGTFCLTELATNLTGYLGVNLTNAYIDNLALGGNATAYMNLTSIPPTALCSDCIFAAVSLIEEQYPEAGDIVVDRQSNTTINSFLNSTCEASDLSVSQNGTLPEGVEVAAINGTESYTLPSITGTPMVTATGLPDAVTGGPAAAASGATSAVAPPAAPSAPSAPAGQMAEKRRWVGQQ